MVRLFCASMVSCVAWNRLTDSTSAPCLDGSAQLSAYANGRSVDRALDLPGIGRLRVNVYASDEGLCAAVRILRRDAPELGDLNLPRHGRAARRAAARARRRLRTDGLRQELDARRPRAASPADARRRCSSRSRIRSST